MRPKDFDFELPESLIAQFPAAERTDSRLLKLDRQSGALEAVRFRDVLEALGPDDLLTLNETRVLRARLLGTRASGGGAEILVIRPDKNNGWLAMAKPAKRLRPGSLVAIPHREVPQRKLLLEILEKHEDGLVTVCREDRKPLGPALSEFGEIPLPPYIVRDQLSAVDRERYQTVFGPREGSVAAPTASLHFDAPLLEALGRKGVQIARLTLHVGLGTFAPIRSDTVEAHQMHSEWMEIPEETAKTIHQAKHDGKRVIAVGTTVARALESAADPDNPGRLIPGERETDLFIYPPFNFQIVDSLITNFHLPQSTLLMLVSAFVDPQGTTGWKTLLEAYKYAIRERFRFYSFGDAMWIE